MRLHPKQLDLSKNLAMTGGSILLSAGSDNTPSLAFKDSPNTGLLLDTSKMALVVNGVRMATFNTDDGVTFLGNTALQLHSGTNEDRPEPVAGMIRHNNESDKVEVAFDDEWVNLVNDLDNRLKDARVLKVKKQPGPGEFSSVKTAIESITDATIYNPYIVLIGLGVFVEDPILVPPSVHIKGTHKESSAIVANQPGEVLLSVDASCSLESIRIAGANGVGGTGLHVQGSGVQFETSDVAFPVILRNVLFDSCEKFISIMNHETEFATSFFGSDILMVPGPGCKRGMEVISGPGAITARFQDLTLLNTSTTLEEALYVSGQDIAFYVNGLLVENQVLDPESELSYPENADASFGIGLRGRDGSTIILNNASITGFNKNFYIENAGLPCGLGIIGLAAGFAGTASIHIEHPDTTGSIQGATIGALLNIAPPLDPEARSLLAVVLQDLETGNLINVGGLIVGSRPDSLTDVTELITQGAPMGIVTGGVMSSDGSTTIDVSKGYGFVDTGGDLNSGYVKRLDWDDQSIVLDDDESCYVYFGPEGILAKSASLPEPLSAIVLGRVITTDGEVAVIENVPTNAHHPTNYINRMLRQVAGSLFQTGCSVSENATNARQIDVTSGIYWYGDKKFTPQGGQNLTLGDFYHVDGVYAPSVVLTQVVDNAYYNDGTNLAAIPSGKYVKHTLWTGGEGAFERWMLVRGQQVFDTYIEAEQGAIPTPPPTFNNSITMVAALVMQEGVNSIVAILDARSTLAFRSPSLSAAATHGNLLGLQNDDHPQYLLVNGGRAMSGSLDMDGFNIVDVNQINGITFSSHGSRHGANSSDPVPTGSAVSISSSSVNSAGVSNNLARADHTHEITGFQPSNLELTGLAGISGTGLVARTATGSYASRTISGTSNQITVSNGSGVSGSPSISLVSNPILPGTGSVTIPSGNTAARPVTPTAGMLRWNSTTGAMEFPVDTTWTSLETVKTWTFSGDVSGSGNGTISLVMPNVVTAGAYNRVTVDSKGRVTAGLSRTITGTTNQISVTNGDMSAGNPTLALANNPVLPGINSVTLPIGAQVDRPTSPVNGMLRYNSTSNKMEGYVNSAWEGVVTAPFEPVLIRNIYTGLIGMTNGTTTYNAANTPTTSAGSQLMNQAVTVPVSGTRYMISYAVPVGVSTPGRGVVLALFAGNTFLAATEAWFPAVSGLASTDVNGPQQAVISYTHIAYTTGSLTFSIRVGIAGGSGTWYVGRGSSSNHDFNGANNSSWSIIEV